MFLEWPHHSVCDIACEYANAVMCQSELLSLRGQSYSYILCCLALFPLQCVFGGMSKQEQEPHREIQVVHFFF